MAVYIVKILSVAILPFSVHVHYEGVVNNMLSVLFIQFLYVGLHYEDIVIKYLAFFL